MVIVGPDSGSCLFCNLSRAMDEVTIASNSMFCVVMDRFPIRSGHMLIYPHLHVDDWLEVDGALFRAMLDYSRILLYGIQEAFEERGGLFLAGKERPEHVHLHVLPIGPGLRTTFSGLGTMRRPEASAGERRRAADRILAAIKEVEP